MADVTGKLDSELRAVADPNRGLIGELDDHYTILLLPVRIETHFHVVNERHELRVRDLPGRGRDHRTPPRAHRGRARRRTGAYWTQRAKARAEEDPADADVLARGAMNVLAARYGANREWRWLARETRPRNWDADPSSGADALVFAPIETVAPNSSVPSRASVLPDRFVVMAFAGNRTVHEVVGAPVAATIAFGPDPPNS